MKNYDDNHDRIKRHKKHDFRPEDKLEDPPEKAKYTITIKDLIGSVYFIKDDFWGFRFSGRDSHPGACLYATEELNDTSLVHGTDANSYTAKCFKKISYIVKPSPQNGLKKVGAFILELYHMRLRKLMLYHIDRRVGCLDETDLDEMKKRISEIHPVPWEVDS